MFSCEYCHNLPHLPGCPNAPDPVAVLTCRLCGEGIPEGDRFLDTLAGPVCMGCLEDMDPEELLEIVGERLSTAQGGKQIW